MTTSKSPSSGGEPILVGTPQPRVVIFFDATKDFKVTVKFEQGSDELVATIIKIQDTNPLVSGYHLSIPPFFWYAACQGCRRTRWFTRSITAKIPQTVKILTLPSNLSTVGQALGELQRITIYPNGGPEEHGLPWVGDCRPLLKLQTKTLLQLVIEDGINKIVDGAFVGDRPLTLDLVLPSGLVASPTRTRVFPTLSVKNLTVTKGKDGVVQSFGKLLYDVFLPGATVLFAADITRIENSAFQNCGLGNVLVSSQPSSKLTSIGDFAFAGCDSLASVDLSKTKLETIGMYAFHGCGKLSSALKFPATLEAIGDYAFYNCTNLAAVDLSATNTRSIGAYAFSKCWSLRGLLTIPPWTHTIGDCAFSECSNLTELRLEPNTSVGVSKFLRIGPYAFYGCAGLKGTLKLPLRVSIGEGSFSRCSSLQTLSMEYGVESIGRFAFDGCVGFTGTLVIPERIFLGQAAFRRCLGFTSLRFAGALGNLEPSVFEMCSGLTGTVQLPQLDGEGSRVGARCFDHCTGIEEVQISPTVRSLEDSAFAFCSNLKRVIFPKHRGPELTIGQKCFYECRKLTSSDLAETQVSEIGPCAFECSAIEGKLVLPKTLKFLGAHAFAMCEKLTEVTFQGKLNTLPPLCFEYCKGLQKVQWPEDLEFIGDKAFIQCTSLTGPLVFPSSLSWIGEDAFYLTGCEALTFTPSSVHLRIGRRAFFGCRHIRAPLELVSNITFIGAMAFCCCTSIPALTFQVAPDDDTTLGCIVGSQAFSFCVSITHAGFPNWITEIGDESFGACVGLLDIDFAGGGKGPKLIGDRAFEGCVRMLGPVRLPRSVLNTGRCIFQDCRFDKLEIPSTLSLSDFMSREAPDTGRPLFFTVSQYSVQYILSAKHPKLISSRLQHLVVDTDLELDDVTFEDCSFESVLIERSREDVPGIVNRSYANLANALAPNCRLRIGRGVRELAPEALQGCSFGGDALVRCDDGGPPVVISNSALARCGLSSFSTLGPVKYIFNDDSRVSGVAASEGGPLIMPSWMEGRHTQDTEGEMLRLGAGPEAGELRLNSKPATGAKVMSWFRSTYTKLNKNGELTEVSHLLLDELISSLQNIENKTQAPFAEEERPTLQDPVEDAFR